MKKKKKLGGPMLLNSTTYYKFTLINPVWYWLKYRHIDQWNKLLHLWPSDFQQWCQKNSPLNEIIDVSTNDIRQLRIPHEKNEVRPISYHIQTLT